MIYAVIGVDYKSQLIIVDGSTDSQKYIQNIQSSHTIEDLDNLLL